jgi:hypothetical protein
VTIIDPNQSKFVGKIMVPKSTNYWKEITQIKVDDNHLGSHTLTIGGYTNKHKSGEPASSAEYTNPADYLLVLATYWRGKASSTQRTMITSKDKNFIPEVFVCNAQLYPGGPNVNHQAEYKKAYGVCPARGCHNTLEECKLHSTRGLDRPSESSFCCFRFF